jgi:deazaflavin-dependent oxidoreductase (nitroreductase family)
VPGEIARELSAYGEREKVMTETADDPHDFVRNHLRIYLESDGAVGHVMDFRDWGGRIDQTTLLLRTLGRRSGKVLINPLIYGTMGDDYCVVASKGGAPENPGWYLNLIANPEVRFQVGRNHFRGTWRVLAGEERLEAWHLMVELFPRYGEYKAATEREIPIIKLEPKELIDSIQ